MQRLFGNWLERHRHPASLALHRTDAFVGPLLLTARVDADGNASSREPGDLTGAAAAPVEPGATGVTIRIDEKL